MIRVAESFSESARDTIRYENLYKHVWEIGRMVTAAGSDGTVVDLGGGLGVNLVALRQLGHQGRLVLIDAFDEYDTGNRMGSFAAIESMLREHDVEIIRQDFWSNPVMPLPEAVADVTTCFDVIEHLPGHPLRQLRELHRLLRPDGTCIIGAPNAVSIMKRVKILAGRHPYTAFESWLSEPFHDHYREYSRAEYESLMRQSGFVDVSTSPTAAVSLGRARHGFHRRPLSRFSPIRAALWAVAGVETMAPPLRHTIYAQGRRPA